MRTWRGCDVGQREACSSPRRRPGLDRNNTVTGRWHRLWTDMASAFKSNGARPARLSPRGVSADRPQSERAVRSGLGVVVMLANAGRSPPHAICLARPHQHRERTAARTSDRLGYRTSIPLARGPRAFSHVEHRPTARGTRAPRSAKLGVVVLLANAGHVPRHAFGQSLTAPTSRQVGETGSEEL